MFGHHGYITSPRGWDIWFVGLPKRLEDSQIQLVLAGAGETSGLAAIARALGVQDRVNLVGPYRHADLIKLYSEVNIGVLAYPVDDSWGHTIPNKPVRLSGLRQTGHRLSEQTLSKGGGGSRGRLGPGRRRPGKSRRGCSEWVVSTRTRW